jgi:hypothetical protein
MRNRPLRTSLLIATLLSSAAAFAHHDASNYADQGERIHWRGTVRQVSWDGAHVMYRIDVANADGHAESWQVLGASPRGLARRGIRQATITVGTDVTLDGYLNPFSKVVSPIYLDTGNERHYVGYFGPDGTFLSAFRPKR